MRNWVLLFSVALAGGVIGAWLSSHTGNVINMQSWDAGWVQAIGSILAVAVAIYVPWKIDSDKKKAEEGRNIELRRLSLKALGHEIGTLQNFFKSGISAIDKNDVSDLSSLIAGFVPKDTDSVLAINPQILSVLSHLDDDTSTLYFNVVSRHFYAIVYIWRFKNELNHNLNPDEYSNKLNAREYCFEGENLCQSILVKVRNELGGFTSDLKIG